MPPADLPPDDGKQVTGDALCRKCGAAIGLPLTGKHEPASDGGEWWECEPGQSCPFCGEPLVWLHQPAPKVTP